MTYALKLRKLETFTVSLPTRRAHFWAGLTSPGGHGYLVLRIELENGVVGWGECQPIATWGGDDGARYGETPETARHIIESYLVPSLRDVDLRCIQLVGSAMDRAVRGHPYAKAALEVAVLDAVGHSLCLPVYQLLGGKCRDRVPVAHSIGLMDVSAAVEEAVQVVAEGVKTLKLKIGLDVERDVKLVAAVRRAIGDQTAIRVDANQGYRSWREAVAAVDRMCDYGIAYAEQLVNGIEALAEVSSRCSIPIMADESAWTERDVIKIGEIGAAQYLSVYYTKPGGLWRARRLLTVAGAYQMQSDINGSGEMGIGNAANLHLAAASPEIVLPGTIPVTSTAEVERTKIAGRKYMDDIVVQPFGYDDGELLVPNGPGLGIEVDEAKLEQYRID